jgi:predicted hotdog family 3-hydroxylacyl-ACP dehydratase
MLLIDELVRCDEREVVCAVTVRADNPFVVDGRVPAMISLEYFAQSVAALYAWQHRHSPAPALGKLLGTRALELHVDYLDVGDALTISGRETWRDETLAQFRCELHRGSERLASAAISVSHGPPSPSIPQEAS